MSVQKLVGPVLTPILISIWIAFPSGSAPFAGAWALPVSATSKLDIRTRIVELRHISVDTAIKLLHWDDINDLPAGVVDVTGDNKRHALSIEGTVAGIDGAIQAIDFVDVAPRRVRLVVQVAELRAPAALARGRKTPTAQTVLRSAFRVVSALPWSGDNNDTFPVRMRVVRPVSGAQDLDSGVRVSPRVNDNGTVTLRGTVTLNTLLDDLDLEAASPDAMGMIELVRTTHSGHPLVVGIFHVRPAATPNAPPTCLYVLITPSTI
jgi:hypothetical protein